MSTIGTMMNWEERNSALHATKDARIAELEAEISILKAVRFHDANAVVTLKTLLMKIDHEEQCIRHYERRVQNSTPGAEYHMGQQTFLEAHKKELKILRLAVVGLQHSEAECCF